MGPSSAMGSGVGKGGVCENTKRAGARSQPKWALIPGTFGPHPLSTEGHFQNRVKTALFSVGFERVVRPFWVLGGIIRQEVEANRAFPNFRP